ncbi:MULTISPECIES: hypothetical protein [Paenibacillus]|uniref:Uncharacterized protein n=1 Tax=Paenibacillus curdlanolyticus YK9 TaxID=717606 RepID=E0I849_9BACL|nr:MULTISPECIES: hypothetical protein [Paenibacillus]EFM11354.1 hypothetical protein PaecuDRAFT_1800 [Paenibacillus curdlanolyticus YK9]MWC27102.1 hypothetical protein [Paenibacillus sp. MMS18-CY102]
MAKKGKPINAADVIKRASAILSGPRVPAKTAKDAMKNVTVERDDPLVKRYASK